MNYQLKTMLFKLHLSQHPLLLMAALFHSWVQRELHNPSFNHLYITVLWPK